MAERTNTNAYCMAKNIVSITKYDGNPSRSKFTGSILYHVSKEFSNTILSKASQYLVETIFGYAYVPSSEDMYGEADGLNWFNSRQRRIGYLTSGASEYYWTRILDPSGKAYLVNQSGDITGPYSLTYDYGFRPCIIVRLS